MTMTRASWLCLIFLSWSVSPYFASAQMLRTVALSQTSAVGFLDGEYFLTFNDPILNSAGKTAFTASVLRRNADLTYTGSSGVWSEGPGNLGLVVQVGDHAPDTPVGVNFTDFSNLLLDSDGKVALQAYVNGDGIDSTNNAGIWMERSGTLALVARKGDQAPGTPAGTVYVGLDCSSGRVAAYSSLVSYETGQVSFLGFTKGDGEERINSGLWVGDSNALRKVVHTRNYPSGFPKGQQAPGTLSGERFLTYDSFSENSAGHLAFRGKLSGIGVDNTNDRGVWSTRSGSLSLVAREGSHAPGTPDDVHFRSLLVSIHKTVVQNSSGETAFLASLQGNGVDDSNDLGIWSEGSRSLNLVARTGNHASGTPNGVVFRDFDLAPGMVLNSVGQMAFQATLIGSGVDHMNDAGIWAEDRTGTLRLIAREYDLVEVAPNDFRRIKSLSFNASSFSFFDTGNDDGRRSAFNNLGQLAFQASFYGGTHGIFVSNVATIPEPSGIALVFQSFSMLLVWRRC